MNADFFLSDESYNQAEQLYSPKDLEYQIQCIGYQYGVGRKEASALRNELSEDRIANAMEYFALRDLDPATRLQTYDERVEERKRLMESIKLTALDAFYWQNRPPHPPLTDTNFQAQCVSEFLHIDQEAAAKQLTDLPEGTIATAIDYHDITWYTGAARMSLCVGLMTERDLLANQYGLTPFEAMERRDHPAPALTSPYLYQFPVQIPMYEPLSLPAGFCNRINEGLNKLDGISSGVSPIIEQTAIVEAEPSPGPVYDRGTLILWSKEELSDEQMGVIEGAIETLPACWRVEEGSLVTLTDEDLSDLSKMEELAQ